MLSNLLDMWYRTMSIWNHKPCIMDPWFTNVLQSVICCIRCKYRLENCYLCDPLQICSVHTIETDTWYKSKTCVKGHRALALLGEPISLLSASYICRPAGVICNNRFLFSVQEHTSSFTWNITLPRSLYYEMRTPAIIEILMLRYFLNHFNNLSWDYYIK